MGNKKEFIDCFWCRLLFIFPPTSWLRYGLTLENNDAALLPGHAGCFRDSNATLIVHMWCYLSLRPRCRASSAEAFTGDRGYSGGCPPSCILHPSTHAGDGKASLIRDHKPREAKEKQLFGFTENLAVMSKLSEPLKAFINAAHARPNTTPAPRHIGSVYEKVAQDASAKSVGMPAWLTASVRVSRMSIIAKCSSDRLPCVLDGRHHDDELATLNARAVRLGNLTYTYSGAEQWRLGRRANA